MAPQWRAKSIQAEEVPASAPAPPPVPEEPGWNVKGRQRGRGRGGKAGEKGQSLTGKDDGQSQDQGKDQRQGFVGKGQGQSQCKDQGAVKGHGKGGKGKGGQSLRGPRAKLCCDDGCFGSGPVCVPGSVGGCDSQLGAAIPCGFGEHPKTLPAVGVAVPEEAVVFSTMSRAKLRLLQAKWEEAGGVGQLQGAWQVQNKRLDRQFRATAHNLALDLGRTSDMIDGWHGTPEQNVFSIAQNGFDPRRRSGQVYGAGEYFAKDPKVSVGYARGGAFMFLCKLLLGADGIDHTWVDAQKYYVVKQRNNYMQALPVYLLQFLPHGKAGPSELGLRLALAREPPRAEEASTLQHRQRGGQAACEARPDAGMSAEKTKHLWLGWLAPELASATDDAIHDDVCAFLDGLAVAEVLPGRNGARVGAYVRLQAWLPKEAFLQLQSRQYRGCFRISVDDAQPLNPRCVGKACPRLTGPSGYCRGWNIAGHRAWQWGCPFDHPMELRPTHNATYSLEQVQPQTAKYDEIQSAFSQASPFHNGTPQLVAVHRVVNKALQRMYDKRRNFLEEKHGFSVEKELWHGTNCKAIPELLTHGLQPPSDTRPGQDCPKSGGKGLCTTLCGTGCRHCREPHAWDRCHMYGLGIYLADFAQKSHRYVREPELQQVECASANRGWGCGEGVGGSIRGINGELWGRVYADEGYCWRLESGRMAKKETEGLKWNWDCGTGVGANIIGANGQLWGQVVADLDNCWRLDSGRIAKKETEGLKWHWDASGGPRAAQTSQQQVYSMLLCRVCLGNPYLVEGNLMAPAAMHDVCWCQDPSEQLETLAEDWSLARGHDTYYVRGLSGMQRAGLGVYNSEYIVFQPFQVLPLYKVDYVLQ